MKYDVINLDWDGVLWDFKAAFCKWHGLEITPDDRWEFYRDLGMNDQEFKTALRRLPKEFWAQEEFITEDARSLVEWARANGTTVRVLTVTGGDGACLSGKRDLASKLFFLPVYAVRSSGDKRHHGSGRGKSALLIDDKVETIREWDLSEQHEETNHSYLWPAEYNKGEEGVFYFDKSWLKLPEIKKKAHWALTDEDRSALLKEMAAEKAAEKPVIDYASMDEAKRRKMTPIYSGCLAYFPDALAQVAQNSMVGHYQHNDPSEPMYWDRSKSADELDAIIRHLADHSKDPYDVDGRLHLSKVAWRALAMLQKFIEDEKLSKNS